MIYKYLTFTFLVITVCVFIIWFYLYLTHRRIRSFLHASLFMLCGAVILLAQFYLEEVPSTRAIVWWTKLQYAGIFGYIYTFSRFVYDIIEKAISRRMRLTLLVATWGSIAMTFFTSLIITNRLSVIGNNLEAESGVLYPFFIALTVVVVAYFYFQIVSRSLNRPARNYNYTPIIVTVGLTILMGLMDAVGVILKRPLFQFIPEPFVIGVFIVCLGFLWTYTSQYSWVLDALDQTEKEVDKLVARSNQSFMELVVLIAKTLEAKDHYTAGHSLRVMDCSIKIARALKLSEVDIEILKQSCLLHDIGKIKIPDGILNKKSPLTEKEWEFIFQHPLVGRQILSTVSDFQDIVDVIYAHHERVDGQGYPRGLKKGEIPLLARILSVADAYDAMRSERPYRKPKNKLQAQTELERVKGTQLDPAIVDALLGIIVAEGDA
jgi:putative nucleotidyltransferase with HDIG domain